MKKAKENTPNKKKSLAKKITGWFLTGFFGILIVTVAVFNYMNSHGDGMIFGATYPCVLTDSMVPVYKVHDVIVVKKIKENQVADLVKEFISGQDGKLGTEDDIEETKGDDGKITYEDTITTNEENKKWAIDLSFKFDIFNDGKEVSVTHRLESVIVDYTKTNINEKYTFIAHGINKESKQTRGMDLTNQRQTFHFDKIIGRVQGTNGALTFMYKCFTSVWGLIFLVGLPALYLIVISVMEIVNAGLKKNPEKVAPVASDNGDPLSGLSKEEQEKLKKELLAQLMEKGEK